MVINLDASTKIFVDSLKDEEINLAIVFTKIGINKVKIYKEVPDRMVKEIRIVFKVIVSVNNYIYEEVIVDVEN